MRWLLLPAVLLVAPLGAQEGPTSEMRQKLRARIVEVVPSVPAKKSEESPAADPEAKAETPSVGSAATGSSPPAVVRAGRPIPRLGEAVMREESRRVPGERRRAAAASATPAAEPAGTAATAGAVEPGMLILPTLQITAERLTQLEARVRDIDRRQRSEEKAMTPTWVDTVLDLPILSFLFGGHTAERRAAVARARVEVMRWERILRVARDLATTPEEKARIDEDLRLVGDLTRGWE